MEPAVLHGVEARLLRDGVEVEHLREAVTAWLDAVERGERHASLFVPFEPGVGSSS